MSTDSSIEPAQVNAVLVNELSILFVLSPTEFRALNAAIILSVLYPDRTEFRATEILGVLSSFSGKNPLLHLVKKALNGLVVHGILHRTTDDTGFDCFNFSTELNFPLYIKEVVRTYNQIVSSNLETSNNNLELTRNTRTSIDNVTQEMSSHSFSKKEEKTQRSRPIIDEVIEVTNRPSQQALLPGMSDELCWSKTKYAKVTEGVLRVLNKASNGIVGNRITRKRVTVIKSRMLEGLKYWELCCAAEGICISPWHMQSKRISFELVFRNFERVEKCIALWGSYAPFERLVWANKEYGFEIPITRQSEAIAFDAKNKKLVDDLNFFSAKKESEIKRLTAKRDEAISSKQDYIKYITEMVPDNEDYIREETEKANEEIAKAEAEFETHFNLIIPELDKKIEEIKGTLAW
jgi:hypothetical protein